MGAETGPGGEPVIQFIPMQKQHISGVLAIEDVSFPTPWSQQSFEYEVEDNTFARYLVAVQDGQVLGYGGMWIILDESHVTNIAIHPAYRQQGLGRQLLCNLVAWASQLGCRQMTLEVRISNAVARRLYEGCGFIQRGIRKGYYTDNHEDALIMWNDQLASVGCGQNERCNHE